MVAFSLSSSAVGHITAAIQFGFITGTLIFALLTIADRFSPSKVFLTCALLGGLINLAMIWDGNTYPSILLIRFLTGFFLAGIYPVGMKIAADYFDKGLGKALGLLVGALVLGTALPHLLKGMTLSISWKTVIFSTSSLAALGGTIMYILVPDGPYRKPSQKLDLSAFFKVFQKREFRAVAFGYFGHMWELYAFWTFVPIMIETFNSNSNEQTLNNPLTSFFVIGLGGLACVLGGYLSLKFGTKRIAFFALLSSCVCCLVSPFFLSASNESLLIGFLVFWGLVVIADSPLFSTLVAQNADPKIKGTALTIVNCIGFGITILSIQLLNYLIDYTSSTSVYIILAIGPILGLAALTNKKRPYLK